MIEDVNEIDRDEAILLLKSEKRMENVAGVYASLYHRFFDDEVRDLVTSFSDSDYPVPCDRNLSHLVDEYLDAAEADLPS